MKLKKGFTLVELLVVIAVIGILSAVVILNTQSAKTKARDAIIKSDVAKVKTAVGMYYDSTPNYYNLFCGVGRGLGTCETLSATGDAESVANIRMLATDICDQQGGCLTTGYTRVGLIIFARSATPEKYAIVANLSPIFSTANWYCADSTNNIGVYHGSAASTTYGSGLPVCSGI